MTQHREELVEVEEIKDKVVNQLYAVLEYVEEAEDDDHRHRQLEIWADWIIEGISQAIAEGKVKFLDEIGRGRVARVYTIMDEGKLVSEYIKVAPDSLLQELRLADTLIALRKESHRDPRRGRRQMK